MSINLTLTITLGELYAIRAALETFLRKQSNFDPLAQNAESVLTAIDAWRETPEGKEN